MDDSISKLSKLLSSPEGTQQIKNLLGSLSSGTQSEEGSNSEGEDLGDYFAQASQGGTAGALNGFNTEFISKISEVMAVMNDTNDSRITLLTSLKPFMKGRRASQIDSAMRLMQITKLSGILRKPLGR